MSNHPLDIEGSVYELYIITNMINAWNYVGIGKSSTGRFCDHMEGRGSRLLYDDVLIYGQDKFSQQIVITGLLKTEVNQLEVEYISKLNCRYPNGYNLASGGHYFVHNEVSKKICGDKARETWTGRKHKPESKQAISESQMGEKNHRYGKSIVFTNTHRENLSKSLIGKVKTQEHIENMSKAQRKPHFSEAQLAENKRRSERMRGNFLHLARTEEIWKRIIQSRKESYARGDWRHKPLTEEQRAKRSQLVSGEKNPMYGMKNPKLSAYNKIRAENKNACRVSVESLEEIWKRLSHSS